MERTWNQEFGEKHSITNLILVKDNGNSALANVCRMTDFWLWLWLWLRGDRCCDLKTLIRTDHIYF